MLDGLEIEVGVDGYKYERFRFEGYKYMNQFLFKRIFSYGVGQRGYGEGRLIYVVGFILVVFCEGVLIQSQGFIIKVKVFYSKDI